MRILQIFFFYLFKNFKDIWIFNGSFLENGKSLIKFFRRTAIGNVCANPVSVRFG